MENHRKFTADKNAILMALDQLCQTMDVMSQILARLKRSVEQAQITDYSLSLDSHRHSDSNTSSQNHQRQNSVVKTPGSKNQANGETTSKQPIVLH